MTQDQESDGAGVEVEDEIVGAAGDGDNVMNGEAPILERRDGSDDNLLKRAIFSVPIDVTVTVGTARPLIGELLEMKRNHLLPLDATIEDPVELRVKDRVIARGELTEAPEGEGQLAIRLTEVVNITDILDQ